MIVNTDSATLFDDFSPRPEEHFRLCFFGCILGLIESVSACAGSFEKAMERFPFLAGYNNELAERLNGLSSEEARARWAASLDSWERNTPAHLPLRALREVAAVSHAELMWLLINGLIEEDVRFGQIFEVFQGTPHRRPTVGFLRHGLPPPAESADALDLLLRLHRCGALELSNPDAPRPEWVFRFPVIVWDALRTGSLDPAAEQARYRPPAECPRIEDLILKPEVAAQVATVSRLVERGEMDTIVVRGPRHNGRRTVLGAIARSLGRGAVEIRKNDSSNAFTANRAGILAVLLHALPIIECNLSPGEIETLPDLQPVSIPLGVAVGRTGGITGPRAQRALFVDLEIPEPADRARLWGRSSPHGEIADLDALAARYRLTSGNVGRAAQLARTRAALAGRSEIEPGDVLEATRSLDRQGLDTLAHRLPAADTLSRLCASEQVIRELDHLSLRCRHRESLPNALERTPGGRLNCGVRALFTGPTGTGKTLAARLLAGTLQKDIYRLDLSSVVNKYIGETEKNLSRLFDCAEELDVILLLDEGDALLTQRTDVQNANDRYANLETNFLLQRMESFQGILIVTTNARNRIDAAFERRMDVVVEFNAPSAEERWNLWQGHLPGNCTVDRQRLAEVAAECELTGGQIHNAVLHATLLALDNGGIVTPEYLEAAVRREYSKRGGVSPLRV